MTTRIFNPAARKLITKARQKQPTGPLPEAIQAQARAGKYSYDPTGYTHGTRPEMPTRQLREAERVMEGVLSPMSTVARKLKKVLKK